MLPFFKSTFSNFRPARSNHEADEQPHISPQHPRSVQHNSAARDGSLDSEDEPKLHREPTDPAPRKKLSQRLFKKLSRHFPKQPREPLPDMNNHDHPQRAARRHADGHGVIVLSSDDEGPPAPHRRRVQRHNGEAAPAEPGVPALRVDDMQQLDPQHLRAPHDAADMNGEAPRGAGPVGPGELNRLGNYLQRALPWHGQAGAAARAEGLPLHPQFDPGLQFGQQVAPLAPRNQVQNHVQPRNLQNRPDWDLVDFGMDGLEDVDEFDIGEQDDVFNDPNDPLYPPVAQPAQGEARDKSYPRPQPYPAPAVPAAQPSVSRRVVHSSGVRQNDSVESKDDSIATVAELFPGICRDHVSHLYDTISPSSHGLIAHILDQPGYPKAKDKQKTLKRKREVDEDAEAARKYGDVNRIVSDDVGSVRPYIRTILSAEFNRVPMVFIDATLSRSGFRLFTSYQVLEEAHRTFNPEHPAYNQVKTARRSRISFQPEDVERMLAEPNADPQRSEVLQELQAARRMKQKSDAKRAADRLFELEEEENVRQAKVEGSMADCCCCFSDFPLNRMVHCNGDEPHPFCRGCALRNAETEIGKSLYELHCMSMDGCQASFSMDQRAQFIDEKTKVALDRNEMESNLRLAGIENLASCPFCPFAAEYPPIAIDREFRCQAPDCERVSCRHCNLETHLPKTCDENARDLAKEGLSIRRLIEEAMSEALIRRCNKCNTPFVKEEGCNKMTCTRNGCFNIQCYVCSISCDYSHFNDTARGGKVGNCPLFESVEQRHDDEVKRAEEEALAKVLANHPEYTAEDLKIKVSEDVKKDDERRKQRATPQIRARMLHDEMQARVAAIAHRIGPRPPHPNDGVGRPLPEQPPADPVVAAAPNADMLDRLQAFIRRDREEGQAGQAEQDADREALRLIVGRRAELLGDNPINGEELQLFQVALMGLRRRMERADINLVNNEQNRPDDQRHREEAARALPALPNDPLRDQINAANADLDAELGIEGEIPAVIGAIPRLRRAGGALQFRDRIPEEDAPVDDPQQWHLLNFWGAMEREQPARYAHQRHRHGRFPAAPRHAREYALDNIFADVAPAPEAPRAPQAWPALPLPRNGHLAVPPQVESRSPHGARSLPDMRVRPGEPVGSPKMREGLHGYRAIEPPARDIAEEEEIREADRTVAAPDIQPLGVSGRKVENQSKVRVGKGVEDPLIDDALVGVARNDTQSQARRRALIQAAIPPDPSQRQRRRHEDGLRMLHGGRQEGEAGPVLEPEPEPQGKFEDENERSIEMRGRGDAEGNSAEGVSNDEAIARVAHARALIRNETAKFQQQAEREQAGQRRLEDAKREFEAQVELRGLRWAHENNV